MIQFSGWVVGSLVLILMAAAVICIMTLARFEATAKDISLKVVSITATVSFVLSAGGFNALVSLANALMPDNGTSREYVSDAEIGKQMFGFESNKTYPLALGARTVAFEASASTYGGLFFAHSSARVSGGTAYLVSFEHDGRTWDISVPVETVTFVKTYEREPSVTLNVRDSQNYFWGYYEQTYEWTDCEWVFKNLLFQKSCIKQYRERSVVEFDKSVVSLGLAKWIQSRIVSSTVVLTPEMHDQLVGRIR